MRFVDYVVLLSFGMFLGSSTFPFARALLESDDGSLLDGYWREAQAGHRHASYNERATRCDDSECTTDTGISKGALILQSFTQNFGLNVTVVIGSLELSTLL